MPTTTARRRSALRTVLLGLLLVFVVLLAVMLVRAVQYTPAPVAELDAPAPLSIDADAAATHLAEAVRFPTISWGDPARTDTAAFLGLHDWLEATYPLVHQNLQRETVADLSLLYTWPGTDASRPAGILMGHLDVVPVTSGSEADWQHPAFDGVIEDGVVFGRGTLDDKASVIGWMEAAEGLLRDGFQPAQTLYFAFGHDEEVGGTAAQAISALLAAREVPVEFVLDEGGMITDGVIGGVDVPVALVGVAEKGYVSLRLTATGEGGHSSAPPANTSVGLIARAVSRLEDAPFPARIDGGTRLMLDAIGPHQGFGQKLALANLWLTAPLVTNMLTADPKTAATVRTTTAATMMRGSDKDNVLPIEAEAVVNFRILPGETVESVTARVREIIDDERVAVELYQFGSDPSPVSPTDTRAFTALAHAIRHAAPEGTVVAPYLVTGATDSRHYLGLTDNVYRFIGATVTPDLLGGVHGTDERVRVDEFGRAVETFTRFLLGL